MRMNTKIKITPGKTHTWRQKKWKMQKKKNCFQNESDSKYLQQLAEENSKTNLYVIQCIWESESRKSIIYSLKVGTNIYLPHIIKVGGEENEVVVEAMQRLHLKQEIPSCKEVVDDGVT